MDSDLFTSIMLVIIMSLYPNSIARDMLYISYLLLLDLFFFPKKCYVIYSQFSVLSRVRHWTMENCGADDVRLTISLTRLRTRDELLNYL